MILICKGIFFVLIFVALAGSTTTNEPVDEAMIPLMNEGIDFEEGQQFEEWTRREHPPRRFRRRNFEPRVAHNDEEDPVRVRRRQRAQFLMLVALVQLFIAFMRLVKGANRDNH